MPTYDYLCESNGLVVEVKHKINDEIATWGELCSRVGRNIGETPENSPVKRLANGGQIVKSSNLGDGGSTMPSCNMGNCCGGVCGLD